MNAIRHLRVSLEMHPNDFIAWKILGDTQAKAGLPDAALKSYRRGIAIAKAPGDAQAAEDMEVCAAVIEKHGAHQPL